MSPRLTGWLIFFSAILLCVAWEKFRQRKINKRNRAEDEALHAEVEKKFAALNARQDAYWASVEADHRDKMHALDPEDPLLP